MKEENKVSNHLIRNLERISSENSIFNYKSGRKAFLSLGQGNIREWLETFLPNTRIILEPKIIGSIIGIQYINGELNKVINKSSQDITESVRSLKKIPKSLPIKNRIEIQGVIYDDKNLSTRTNKTEFIETQNLKSKFKRLKFCAFQIYHCNINHFQSLQELKQLNFEIPQTQFTKFISDFEIYFQCWKEGKLFTSYPTNGLVLKINSRRLQKYLVENNLSIPWAYAIN
jgi:DNA ligase (NAD+)